MEKKHVRMYCEQCKKTNHEVVNKGGQESFVCLACQRKGVEMQNTEIAFLNHNETRRNEADRIIMEEKVRQISDWGLRFQLTQNCILTTDN